MRLCISRSLRRFWLWNCIMSVYLCICVQAASGLTCELRFRWKPGLVFEAYQSATDDSFREHYWNHRHITSPTLPAWSLTYGRWSANLPVILIHIVFFASDVIKRKTKRLKEKYDNIFFWSFCDKVVVPMKNSDVFIKFSGRNWRVETYSFILCP